MSRRACPIFLVSNVSGESLPLLKTFLNVVPTGGVEGSYPVNDDFELSISDVFSVPFVGPSFYPYRRTSSSRITTGTVVSGVILSGSVLSCAPIRDDRLTLASQLRLGGRYSSSWTRFAGRLCSDVDQVDPAQASQRPARRSRPVGLVRTEEDQARCGQERCELDAAACSSYWS